MPAFTGRNDPCPCGSGRKFKRCCLGKVQGEDSLRIRLRRAEARLINDVLEFGLKTFGPSFFEHAWHDFHLDDAPEGPYDESPEFESMFLAFYAFDFVADESYEAWQPGWPDRPLALHWLDTQRPALDDVELAFLHAACASPLSVMAIEAVDAGRSLDLRDVLTGRRFRVLEQSASRMLKPADLHFTRVVTAGGASLMLGASPYSIPPDWHTVVLDWRDRTFRRRTPGRGDLVDFGIEMRELYFEVTRRLLAPELPKLRNTDGDDLELTTLVFDIAMPVAQAFERLRPLATVGADELIDEVIRDRAGTVTEARFSWAKAGNRQHRSWTNTVLASLHLASGRLTADVNSARRADRLIREVRRCLGRSATLASRSATPVEELMRGRIEGEAPGGARASAGPDPERPPELVEAEADLRRQYAFEWLDTRVQALGNKTPRQAVRTARGRERVEALLASFERYAADSGEPDDGRFVAMRRELGLSDTARPGLQARPARQ